MELEHFVKSLLVSGSSISPGMMRRIICDPKFSPYFAHLVPPFSGLIAISGSTRSRIGSQIFGL
jgi:hypothetical protein